MTVKRQPPGGGELPRHRGWSPASGKCATSSLPHTTWKTPPAPPYSTAYASSSLTTPERPRSSCPVTTRRTTRPPSAVPVDATQIARSALAMLARSRTERRVSRQWNRAQNRRSVFKHTSAYVPIWRAWRRSSGDIRCARSVHPDRAQIGRYGAPVNPNWSRGTRSVCRSPR